MCPSITNTLIFFFSTPSLKHLHPFGSSYISRKNAPGPFEGYNSEENGFGKMRKDAFWGYVAPHPFFSLKTPFKLALPPSGASISLNTYIHSSAYLTFHFQQKCK